MGGRCAVLQIRGEFNHEKMGPESWPGACQVTAHGKCEEGEKPEKALAREVVEELGGDAAEIVLACKLMISAGYNFVKLSEVEMEREIVITYGVVAKSRFLSQLKLSASTGGIRLITRDKVENIVDLKKFDKAIGVWDRTVTAMFADEKEAVRLAFEKLG